MKYNSLVLGFSGRIRDIREDPFSTNSSTVVGVGAVKKGILMEKLWWL